MSMTDGGPSAQTPHSLGQAIERLRGRWGWMLAYGVIVSLFGVFALALVALSTLATVVLIAVLLILAGGMEIILGLGARDWTHFFLWIISGLLYIAVGAFAIARPVEAATAFTLIIGAGFLAAGVVRIWLGASLPSSAKWYVVFAGVVTVVLGLFILLGWPGDTPFVLGTLFGVDLLFYGAGWIGLAFRLRHA